MGRGGGGGAMMYGQVAYSVYEWAANSRWGQKDDVGRDACSAKGSWIGEYTP